MADPGERHRGARLPYFWTKLRPDGPKKNSLRPPPPRLSLGLDDDRPSPPTLTEGLDPPLVGVGKKRKGRKKNKTTTVYRLPLLKLPNLCVVGARFLSKKISALGVHNPERATPTLGLRHGIDRFIFRNNLEPLIPRETPLCL